MSQMMHATSKNYMTFFSNSIKRFVYKDKKIRERSSYNQDKIKFLNA